MRKSSNPSPPVTYGKVRTTVVLDAADAVSVELSFYASIATRRISRNDVDIGVTFGKP
jgi:hypothetical protein